MIPPAVAAELALSFPGAEEKAHWGHPSYRVGSRIFATLWPEERRMVVKLSYEEQTALCAMEPQGFAPVPGGWGSRGWTSAFLDLLEPDLLEEALDTAWQSVAPKRLLAERTAPL